MIATNEEKHQPEELDREKQVSESALSELLGERPDTVVDWDNFNGDIAFRAPVNKAISHINILCDFLTHPNTTDEGDLKNMIMRTQLAIASLKDVEQNLFNRCMQAREDNRAT